MNRPSQAQLEWANRLLAHEHATGGADAPEISAAGRLYDKLHAHLSTLLGDEGVHSLFVRSAKLVQGEFAGVADLSILDRSAKLREHLLAQTPAVSTEQAAALFATFFALITTFIGERLTTRVLSRAWPTLEVPASREKKHE